MKYYRYDLSTGAIKRLHHNAKYYTKSTGEKTTLELDRIVYCLETNIYECGQNDNSLVFTDTMNLSTILYILKKYNEEIAGLLLSEYALDDIMRLPKYKPDVYNKMTHHIIKSFKKVSNFDIALDELKPLIEVKATVPKIIKEYSKEVIVDLKLGNESYANDFQKIIDENKFSSPEKLKNLLIDLTEDYFQNHHQLDKNEKDNEYNTKNMSLMLLYIYLMEE